MSRDSLLDLLTPLERATLEQEISDYYSQVAEQELSEARIQGDEDFAMVRRRELVRRLNETALGLLCSAAGLYFWTFFSSRFI